MASTRNRLLERAPQLELFVDPDRSWADVPAPGSVSGTTGTYDAAWRNYVASAQQVGWLPADVTAHGTVGLAAALAEAGHRDWSPSTISLYAKIARFAGVDHQRHPPPSAAAEFAQEAAPKLWSTTSNGPVTIRTALYSLILWHWPTTTDDILSLRSNDVEARGTEIVLPNGIVVPDRHGIYPQWQTKRSQFPESQWLFCTTYPSATSQPGQQLSGRGARWAFNYHATLKGFATLTAATYRKHSPHRTHN